MSGPIGYTANMTRNLLILDGSIRRAVYRPTIQWSRSIFDAKVESVHLPSGGDVPALDGFSHLLLTGSEASILEPKEWFEKEADAVREAVRLGMPILGSCFGHQMLVYALSGADYVARSEPPEVGWIAVEQMFEDPLFQGIPNPWHAFAFHLDEVIDPPDPWRVLARSPQCGVQGVRYGAAPIWGIQAHPEITVREAKKYLRLVKRFLGTVPESVAEAMNQPPRDDEITETLIRNFLSAPSPTTS